MSQVNANFKHLEVESRPSTVCVIAGDDAAPEVMRPTD